MHSIKRAWLVTFLTAIVMVLLTGPANAQQLVRSPARQLSATSGDAVITWNNNASAAALGACLAPTKNPLQSSIAGNEDAYVAKLNPAGKNIWQI